MSLRIRNFGPHCDNLLQTSPSSSSSSSPPWVTFLYEATEPSELRLPAGDPEPSTHQTWYESGGKASQSLSASQTILDT